MDDGNRKSVKKTDIRYQKKVDKGNKSWDNVSRANKIGEIKNDLYPALSRTQWAKYYTAIAERGHLEKVHVGDVAFVSVDDKIIISERMMLGEDAHDFQVVNVVSCYLLEKPNIRNQIKELITSAGKDAEYGRIYRNVLQLCQSYDENAVLSIYDRSSAKYVDYDAETIEAYISRRVHRNGGKWNVRGNLLYGDESGIQTDSRPPIKKQLKSYAEKTDRELLAQHLEENSQAVGEILRRSSETNMNERTMTRLVSKRLREYGMYGSVLSAEKMIASK